MRGFVSGRTLAALLVVASGLLASPSPALAGDEFVFTLKNGRKIRGELMGEDPKVYRIKAPGGTLAIAREDVTKIEAAEKRPDPSPQPGTGNTKPSPAPSAAPVTVAGPVPDLPLVRTQVPDTADAEGLFPPEARIGGLTKMADGATVPAWKRKVVDDFLKDSPGPRQIADWLKANEDLLPDDLIYAVAYAQRCPQFTVRQGLFDGWAARLPAEVVEKRLLPYATSDLYNTRHEALRALKPYATWETSGTELLKLLDIPFDHSNDVATEVLEALAKRAAPTETIVTELIRRAKLPITSHARACYLKLITTTAEAGSGTALGFMRGLWARLSPPSVREIPLHERTLLLDRLLRALKAHGQENDPADFVFEILKDPKPHVRELAPFAVERLYEYGDFSRVADLVPVLADAENANESSLVFSIYSTAGRILGRKFDSVDAFKQWWEEVRTAYEGREALMSDLRSGGTSGVAAAASLGPIRLPAVTAALRDAAANGPDARTRRAASYALAERKDRKGIPSILTALEKADAETRGGIGNILTEFANGAVVPLASPELARKWWQEHMPEDFR